MFGIPLEPTMVPFLGPRSPVVILFTWINVHGFAIAKKRRAVLVRLMMTISLPGVNTENYCGVCKKSK